MIRFEGEREFPLPHATVVAKLSDAAFLVSCLKNVEDLIDSSPDRAAWKLRTGFSFLSTSLEVTLSVTAREERRTQFDAHSKGVGASSLVRAVLDFESTGEKTIVRYAADVVERTGFLKIVSPGLIQAAARTVIEDTWKAIEEKLGSESA